MSVYFSNFVFLLALINPVSKIFVISILAKNTEKSKLRFIIIRSSSIAAAILIIFAIAGDFLLKNIFHVQLYSFQIVGGLILAIRGFQALNKGIFFEVNAKQRLEDVSIVPIASPMIAGPATLAAAVSFPAQYGMPATIYPLVAAIVVNSFVMFFSQNISNILKKYNLYGVLIRITGLIVATIGTQMMLSGFTEYIKG